MIKIDYNIILNMNIIIQCFFFQATLITLGVQVYEILRPKFPHIVEIIQRIPNTNLADIQKLDEKISMNSQTKGNKIDKYKKDLFKKITAQVTLNSINSISIELYAQINFVGCSLLVKTLVSFFGKRQSLRIYGQLQELQ